MEPGKKPRTKSTAVARHNGPPPNAKAREPKQPSDARSAKRRGVITDDERRSLIAEAAYLAAERREFQGGSAEKDWLQAEAEIDARLLRREQSNQS